MRKILFLMLLTISFFAHASDIEGDTNNDGYLSGKEQYLRDNPPITQQKTEDYQPATMTGGNSASKIVERDAEGHIKRSESEKNDFKAEHPCPANGHISGACPGYVIDHIKPLACGGEDVPSNMQWQIVAEGKAKDKWERNGCKPSKSYSKKVSKSKENRVVYDSSQDPDYYNRESYSGNNRGYYSTDKSVYTGKRGGRYTLSASGHKEYLRRK